MTHLGRDHGVGNHCDMLLCSGYLHTWRNTPTDLLYCVGYRLWVIIDLLNIICQCHMFNKLWNYALLSSSVSRDLASLFSISDIQFLRHPVFDLCFPLVLSLSVSVSMVLLSVPPSLLSSCPTLTLMVFNKSFHPQPAQNFFFLQNHISAVSSPLHVIVYCSWLTSRCKFFNKRF